jgi:hypothetical protein
MSIINLARDISALAGISLTPCFSRVFCELLTFNRFNGLSANGKPLKRLQFFVRHATPR